MRTLLSAIGVVLTLTSFKHRDHIEISFFVS